MKIFALKSQKLLPRQNSEDKISVGNRTGLIGSLEGDLLLFSSKKKALKYVDSVGLSNQVEVFTPSFSLGYLLATSASIDHFSGALLDEIDFIAFFSCISGGFLLPSHFYRTRKDGFETLWNDDEWHKENIDMENPICACGGQLAPYYPFSLDFDNQKAIPGLWQVIAGSYSSFDGTHCCSLVLIDIEQPSETFFIEVLLRSDDMEESIYYHFTPDGVSRVEKGEKVQFIDPWDICPLTGLVRLSIPDINSREGVDSCELFLCDNSHDELVPKRVDSTGKASNLPIIQYESLNLENNKIFNDLLAKKDFKF